MAITELPVPPSRGDPENFPDRADAFMAALPRFAGEANQLQDDVNAKQLAAADSATSAAVSQGDAAASKTAAQQSASAASSSEQGAESKAVAAAVSATLAKDWASKIGAPVDGVGFSAKHYAQLAAEGAGLPVRFLESLPGTNIGPIYVPSQGAMEWRDGRYVVQRGDHGQCRLIWVGTAECRLVPFNGNGLIINDRQYRIDAGGVSILNTAMAAGAGMYYIVARDNGSGGIKLDAVPATIGRATHTNGVEILTGRPDLTLVGMVIRGVVSEFVSSVANRQVASWFNRVSTPLIQASTNSQTTSATYVALTPSISTLMWKGGLAKLNAAGIVRPDGAGSPGAYLALTVNGSSIGGGQGYSTGSSGQQMATAVTTMYGANADAFFSFAPFGATNIPSVPVTFSQDFNVEIFL